MEHLFVLVDSGYSLNFLLDSSGLSISCIFMMQSILLIEIYSVSR